jgi:type II secretory pathway predicted ATPase ExeA
MHVEQNIEGLAPFQAQLNTAQFFAGGGRDTVLLAIKAAFRDQVGIVTLIGEEGSGKTMLCKMLHEQWDSSCKVVLLPQTVKSFEDIVQATARECDLQYPAETKRDDVKRIFLELVASLRLRGESLLLVCDEAEKMYLATLERMRKVLDDVNQDGGGLHLLFSGRESLAGHFGQLDLCDFELISEKQFVLSIFDKDDIWSYLNFCMQAHGGNVQQEVFTREAAEKIASMGMGNLRRINRFADIALRSSDAENSLLVLVDHVKEGDASGDLQAVKPGLLQRIPSLPKLPFSLAYSLGGAGVLSVLLLLFVFRGDDDIKDIGNLPQLQESVESTSPVMAIVSTAQDVPPQESPKETVERVTPDPVRNEPVETATERGEVEEEVEVPVVTAPDLKSGQSQKEKSIEELESVAATPQASRQHTPVEISPVEIVERVAGESRVPELSSQGKNSPEKLTRITAGAKKQVPEQAVVAPVIPGDPVLASLVVGGNRWQTGVDDARFSIQLMALTSDQAEENLKRILLEPEYQKIVDKLVMLKRPSDPPVILVFYGLYPSMAAARNARNNMPIFLRKHHPYAISVRGAVEKARME